MISQPRFVTQSVRSFEFVLYTIGVILLTKNGDGISTIPDLSKIKNYVYETGGGQGGFVYHIELGVDLQNNRGVSSSHLKRGRHFFSSP
jgi:hypothetical protein